MTVLGRDAASAFEEWVTPHLSSMWLLASRLAGTADREDVYQQALALAWSRWSTYDQGRGSPRTWLLLLVADRSRKAVRRRRPAAALVDIAAPPTDPELRMDVTRAVEALPHRQRLAVELHYTLDLSVSDTAAVMGCAVGTVSSTLSDARAALRRHLEGHP